VFDIPLLAARLVAATRWAQTDSQTTGLPIGYSGASTGAGAALWAAAELGDDIRAVVSCGGRPDLAAPRLADVRAPVQLIVGGRDDVVVERPATTTQHQRSQGCSAARRKRQSHTATTAPRRPTTSPICLGAYRP
jgi:dienelactone hydrolase